MPSMKNTTTVTMDGWLVTRAAASDFICLIVYVPASTSRKPSANA